MSQIVKQSILLMGVGWFALSLPTHASVSELETAILYACPSDWEPVDQRAQFIPDEDVWQDNIPDLAAFIRYAHDNLTGDYGEYAGIYSFSAPEMVAYECGINKYAFYQSLKQSTQSLIDALAQAADADNDGVHDALDLCAGTTQGQIVNGQGCSDLQLIGDDDGDGVLNDEDECANTSAGETVNEEGCSIAQLDLIDTDGDGTPDYQDAYPRQSIGMCPAE